MRAHSLATPVLPRPEARPFRVESLVHRVLNGQIRVPDFQRPLKWQSDDVLSLLDSISRGFPVGTLLLWQHPAEAAHLRYGSLTLDVPARSDALMVVDGQQRIRALTQSLAGAGHPEEPFAAFYDVPTQRFLRLRRHEEPAPHQIPLTEVLDSARLIAWLLEQERTILEAIRAPAIELGKRLREYEIPAYVVVNADEEAVREIFRRANKSGRRLEEHEIFDAIHRNRDGVTPANLGDVARSLAARYAFGGPDEKVLLKMLQAIRGVDASKAPLPELGEETHARLVDLERSAAAVIGFLRREATIPHASLLPYKLPLVVLARFFSRFPEPSPRSIELLARWLWRGALTGKHTGATITTRKMLGAIGSDEIAAVQGLLDQVPWTEDDRPDLGGRFAWQTAASKVLALALLDLGPRDLGDGRAVTPDPRTSSDDPKPWRTLCRRILPQARDAGLANYMFHGTCPSSLIKKITGCEHPQWLGSHGIMPEAQEALRRGDTATFLALRAAILRETVDDFIARRAGAGEIDAPAPASLLSRRPG